MGYLLDAPQPRQRERRHPAFCLVMRQQIPCDARSRSGTPIWRAGAISGTFRWGGFIIAQMCIIFQNIAIDRKMDMEEHMYTTSL